MAHLTDLSRVKEPLGTANGLPNAHYIDPTVFAEERDALLFGQWAGLGVAADVPEAGDAKPITFMGMPLLLLLQNQKTYSHSLTKVLRCCKVSVRKLQSINNFNCSTYMIDGYVAFG